LDDNLLNIGRKKFEGCGGLELREEIRVTIAAQACMLLINREVPCYPGLKSILVYPHTYVSGQKGLFGGDNGQGFSTAHQRAADSQNQPVFENSLI